MSRRRLIILKCACSNGHPIDQAIVNEDPSRLGLGIDSVFTVRVMGASRLPAKDLLPLKAFHEQLAP